MVDKKQVGVGWEFMSGDKEDQETFVRYIVNAIDETITIEQSIEGDSESVIVPVDELADILIRLIRTRYKIA